MNIDSFRFGLWFQYWSIKLPLAHGSPQITKPIEHFTSNADEHRCPQIRNTTLDAKLNLC